MLLSIFKSDTPLQVQIPWSEWQSGLLWYHLKAGHLCGFGIPARPPDFSLFIYFGASGTQNWVKHVVGFCHMFLQALVLLDHMFFFPFPSLASCTKHATLQFILCVYINTCNCILENCQGVFFFLIMQIVLCHGSPFALLPFFLHFKSFWSSHVAINKEFIISDYPVCTPITLIIFSSSDEHLRCFLAAMINTTMTLLLHVAWWIWTGILLG